MHDLSVSGWFTFVDVTSRYVRLLLKHFCIFFNNPGDHVPGTVLAWLRTHHAYRCYAH